jgi:hypothetical protein
MAALPAAAVCQEQPGLLAFEGARPIAASELAAHGVALVRRPTTQQVERVEWRRHGQTASILIKACDDVEVGMSVDGEVLVVLAGGIRDPLDLYLARGTGKREIARHPTNNGRRLPEADGRGSWPLLSGSEVVVFGYEQGGRMEVRAVGFGGRVFAQRRAPLGARGFAPSLDPATGEITVRIDGDPEPLAFFHPRSPKLEVVPGVLDFGMVPVQAFERRELALRNTGGIPLVAELRVEGEAFALHGERALELAPGSEALVTLSFGPVAGGEREGGLLVASRSLPADSRVALRGAGFEPPAPAAVSASPSPPPAARGAAVEDRPVETPERAAVGRARPLPVVEDRVERPSIGRDGDIVVVTAPPGRRVLVVAVADEAVAAERGPRPLAAFSGRAGADGRLRASLQQLGVERGGLRLLAILPGEPGPAWSEPLPIPADG